MPGSKLIQDRLKDEVSDKCRIGFDPNLAVANFNKIMYDIAKECLTTKLKLVFKSDQKKCNKWMNDSCLKAKKKFEKGKRKFLMFPDNMGGRLTHINIAKNARKPSI